MQSIDVDEKTAQILRTLAEAHGVTVSVYLRQVASQRAFTLESNVTGDFETELASLAFESTASLPSDFSRADIYSDHD